MATFEPRQDRSARPSGDAPRRRACERSSSGSDVPAASGWSSYIVRAERSCPATIGATRPAPPVRASQAAGRARERSGRSCGYQPRSHRADPATAPRGGPHLGHPAIELAEPLITGLQGHRPIDERAVDLALEVSTPALDLLARGRVRHRPSVPFAFGDVEGRRWRGRRPGSHRGPETEVPNGP